MQVNGLSKTTIHANKSIYQKKIEMNFDTTHSYAPCAVCHTLYNVCVLH